MARGYIIRWAILMALIAFVGIAITRSFTSASFEQETEKQIAIQQIHVSGTCELSERVLSLEPNWLIELCARYGTSAYEAARRYPALSPKIFDLYGEVPEFRENLDAYGHPIIPIIGFFLDNGSTEYLNKTMFGQWLAQLRGEQGSTKDFVPPTPAQYGLLAILDMKVQGYDFLGQFTIKDGVAIRLQSKHVLTFTEHLFTGGITKLEEVLRRGERNPTTGEVFEAALDSTILVGASAKAVSILRGAGKLARVGEVIKGVDTAEETAAATRGFRLIDIATSAGKVGIIAVPVGIAGFAVTHPVWTTRYAGWLAEKAGLPAIVGEVALWLFVGGVLAFFLQWLILPFTAGLMLWMTLGLLKLSGRSGLRIFRATIIAGEKLMRTTATHS